MNLEAKLENGTLGISFNRRPYPLVEKFLDSLRQKGFLISVSQGSVHVFGLEGDLESMACQLSALAREFDEQNYSLIANTLTDVWEFRKCCETHGDLGWPVSDLEKILEDPAVVFTGRWKEVPRLAGHRCLGQRLATGDPVELQRAGEA